MENARDIIASLGGTSAVAAALDIPVQTVDGWRARNKIPHWRVPAVEAAIASTSTPQNPPAA